MRRNREELTRIHKEKCRELKAIRAKMAEDLGIDLHQRECTYEGYCSGTCPKCKQEELQLNAAILKKQLSEADMKRRVAAVGLTTVAAVSLSGCNLNNLSWETEGVAQQPDTYTGDEIGELEGEPITIEGDIEYIPTEETVETETVEELEGDVVCIPTEETESTATEIWEFEGDYEYIEPTEELENELAENEMVEENVEENVVRDLAEISGEAE